MAKKQNSISSEVAQGHIRFNALGLALFSAVLVIATGVLTATLLKRSETRPAGVKVAAEAGIKPQGTVPPWGELESHDIDLEQPEEYVGFELVTNKAPRWVLAGMDRVQARAFLTGFGVATNHVDRMLADGNACVSTNRIVVHPDEEVLYALTPELRSKLYAALAKISDNLYMQYPFCFPGDSFNRWFGEGASDSPQMAIVRKLLYKRGNGLCFSDFEFLMQQTKTEAERMEVVKSLSRQSAVLTRVRIRPDTDIDKLLGYWGRGIQVKDVRPLVESAARLQDGTTISVLYLLPKFARERLYTFPMPSREGDPLMDCHWSTFNFFNDPPDNRFNELSYIASYIKANLYQVATPSQYGDVILVLDDKGDAIHSAVFIADDIVFTKNGGNYAQPWMLMHLSDLLARYTTDAPPRTLIYRSRKL